MRSEDQTREQLVAERDELRRQVADLRAREVKYKKLEDALLEQTEILETINRVGQVLSAELDLHKLVQAITDAATELSRAEFGSFFYNVIDENGESYTLYTLSGASRGNFANFPMPRNTPLFGPTFHGEATVRIADVKKDERYGKNSPYFGMPKGHLAVSSYLAVPVISRSREVLGGLFFGHSRPGVFTERDERIIEGLAAQAAIAMDNARLYQRAQDLATLEERQRIARDLHDSVNQTLFSANLIAETLIHHHQNQPDKTLPRLSELHQLTRGAMASMRGLLMEMRPSMLLNTRLEDLLTQLSDAIQGRSTASVSIDMKVSDSETLPADVRINFYRIAQESLNNILKHAHASQILISINGSPTQVEMRIKDNGDGFTPSTVLSGMGLQAMRERAEKIGGALQVMSQPGAGTEIIVTWKATSEKDANANLS